MRRDLEIRTQRIADAAMAAYGRNLPDWKENSEMAERMDLDEHEFLALMRHLRFLDGDGSPTAEGRELVHCHKGLPTEPLWWDPGAVDKAIVKPRRDKATEAAATAPESRPKTISLKLRVPDP